jgi:hypothetical protein
MHAKKTGMVCILLPTLLLQNKINLHIWDAFNRLRPKGDAFKGERERECVRFALSVSSLARLVTGEEKTQRTQRKNGILPPEPRFYDSH